MNTIARKLARYLANHAGQGFNEDEIRYGLEIVLGAVFQIALIAIAAQILGILQEVVATLLAAVMYRRYSGGVHCGAYYRCTISSMFTYLLLGYLSRFIPVYPFHIYVLALASISSLIIFYRVPVDNPACIISDRSQRNKYKIKTGMVLVIILGLTIVIHYLYKKPVAVAVLLGLLWQNFALLPWGQSYVQMWDRFFVKIERQIIMKGG